MKSMILVAQREFAENAKTKGFWIGILLFPIILMISITVPQMLEEATPTRHFLLIDQTGEFDKTVAGGLNRLHLGDVIKSVRKHMQKHGKGIPEEFDPEKIPAIDAVETRIDEFMNSTQGVEEAQLSESDIAAMKKQLAPMLTEDAPEFEEPRRRFIQVPVPKDIDTSQDFEKIADALRPYLTGEKTVEIDGESAELFAAILIPKNLEDVIIRPGPKMLMTEDRAGIQFWCKNLADNELKNEVERVVNREIRRREYAEADLDQDTINRIQSTRIPFASLNPKKAKGREEVSLADQIRTWAPVAFVYLLWIGIFTISQMLLNNTIEEKSNRIIEVLLSSVTARELMLGKLAGIAAIGLTMIGTWILSGVVVLNIKAGPESEIAVQILEVLKTSGLLPKFALYFFLGYLIYAGIFLAIGSVCNTLKDAQNLMGPVMLIMIIPLMTMMFIPRDPHGVLATVMSWIPIYTPFVMMNRAAADPPLFDVVGTLILLVATALFVLWMTGKVFRIGILRTGQPPKILEMLRWVRAR